MKVHELIKTLEGFDPNADVLVDLSYHRIDAEGKGWRTSTGGDIHHIEDPEGEGAYPVIAIDVDHVVEGAAGGTCDEQARVEQYLVLRQQVKAARYRKLYEAQVGDYERHLLLANQSAWANVVNFLAAELGIESRIVGIGSDRDWPGVG